MFAKFLKHPEHLFILLGMLGAARKPCEPQFYQERADMAFMVVDTEAGLDDALQINTAPANNAIDRRVWTRFHDLNEFALLLR